MSDEEKPLQRITELTICGERYELAANGQGYLVQRTEKDAYGNPIASKVDLETWAKVGIEWDDYGNDLSKLQEKIQSLLDHLVAAHRQLQTSRDARLGVGKEKADQL
jgi:hypothetical protein